MKVIWTVFVFVQFALASWGLWMLRQPDAAQQIAGGFVFILNLVFGVVHTIKIFKE